MFGAGPLAVWVCELIRRGGSERGRLWFWGSVLATGELYGGLCPNPCVVVVDGSVWLLIARCT